MKKGLIAVVASIGIALAGVSAAYAITEAQAQVIPVLETLKMEPVKSKVIGGPQRFKVTKETLKLLQKAMDDGKTVVVESDGSIKFE